MHRPLAPPPPAADRPPTVPPAGAGTIWLLVVTAVAVLTQLYAAIPLLGPVGADLGGDATFALATVFGLCYAAGFLIWGPTSDQYGRKPAMVIGMLALAGATLACAFAPSVGWLAVLRGVQGLAASCFAPVALAYLTEAAPPVRRPAAIGAMSTAFLVAGIAGQVLASSVSLLLGWRWVFLICAIALGIACALIALTVTEPAREARSGHLGHRFTAVAKVASRPSVLALCAAHVTLLLSFVGMYTALGPHLETLGIDPSKVIWLRSAGLPGMFVALLVGPLSQRWGTAGVARAGYALAALGIAAEALLGQSLIGVCAASLVFVTGVAIAVPAMITLFGQAAAPDRAGGMALNGFVLFIGASIGPIASTLTTNFTVLLLAFAAILTVAAVCLTGYAKLTPLVDHARPGHDSPPPREKGQDCSSHAGPRGGAIREEERWS